MLQAQQLPRLFIETPVDNKKYSTERVKLSFMTGMAHFIKIYLRCSQLSVNYEKDGTV